LGFSIAKDRAVSESADAPAVEVVGLNYTFPGRDRPTLADASLSLPAGSLTLVTGPTGSGKSTLLRAVVGLIPRLTRGEMTGAVRLFGRDTLVSTPAELAATIGFVQQSPDDQICTTTVETELAFGLENLNVPADEIGRLIAATAERFGLGSRLLQATPTLSGGQKQRLVLGAVSAMQPRILVCDEPLSRLDPVAAGEWIDELCRLRDAGLTIIVAEHRIEELVRIADRVLHINDGRLVERGAEAPAVAAPSTRYGVLRAEALLQADGLAFRFASVAPPVWSNVSFNIHRGERIALVGPNGAGKSTLAAVLAGVLRPTHGQVAWSKHSASQPTVLVPQQVDLTLFNRTVYDELAFGSRQLGMPTAAIDERVRLTASVLGLDGLLDEAPHALSQGQRVRTAVAAALAMAPRLLILDEPTTGQDGPTLRRIMDAITACIGEPGAPEALLFTTHDLRIAADCADRVFMLAEGTLTADDSPSQLFDDAALLGRAGLRRSER
jgi:energy-coupling factor transport system ATP-binding protein